MQSRVLVTGGAGFIGSHTCLVLLEAGYDLVILDNFSNSSPEALTRVASLANVPHNSQRLKIQQGDIRDPHTLNQLFSDAWASNRPFDAVIHFAGLKAVGESVEKPLMYWDVNVAGSRTLLGYGCPCLPHPCLQQQRHGLRLPHKRPDSRIGTCSTDQPLRLFQSCG